LQKGLNLVKIIILMLLASVALSGCVSIPIPSALPLPSDIPVLSMFL